MLPSGVFSALSARDVNRRARVRPPGRSDVICLYEAHVRRLEQFDVRAVRGTNRVSGNACACTVHWRQRYLTLAPMIERPVKTPCIGVCSTGIGDRVCRGCKRFAHEVIHWNSYSNEQKSLIEERLSRFLSQCTCNKLQVIDPALLKAQLDARQVHYPEHRDAYCGAYCLLKAGGSRIGDPSDYGLMIDAEFRDVPLDRLRRIIDEEFFILSDAYYERYIAVAGVA